MSGDFNTDFNGDFSRVPYVAALAAEISFTAALAGAHGVTGALAAEIDLSAAIVGVYGAGVLVGEVRLEAALAGAHGVKGALAAEVNLTAAIAGHFGAIAGALAAEIDLRADIRGSLRRRRRPAVGGGGKHRRINFPVPPIAAPAPVYLPPVTARLAARLNLRAGFAGYHGAAPMFIPPPLAAPAGGRALAGLRLEAAFAGEVAVFDSEEETLILLLAAA